MRSETRVSGLRAVVGWTVLAIALAAIDASALVAGQPVALAATVSLPFLWWICDHPEWVPSVLAVGLLAEAATFGGLSISRALVPIALMALVMAWLRGALPQMGSRRLVTIIMFYVVLAVASIGWSTDPSLTLSGPGTAYNLAALAIALVNFVAFSLLVQDERDLIRLFTVMAIAATVLGLIGFAQTYAGVPPLGAADQTAAELGPRSTGLAADPNFFAAYQMIVALVMLVLARRASGRQRVIILVGLAIVVFSIYTSGSRGGLIAAAVAAGLLLADTLRRMRLTRATKLALLLIAIFAVAGGTSYYFVSAKGVASARGGASDRTNLWLAAVDAIESHPILGVGYGAFQPQSNVLLLETPGVNFTDFKLLAKGAPVHNAYLESETELGPLGLALFVAIIATALASLVRAARKCEQLGRDLLSQVAAACAIGLVGFAVASIFLSTESNRALWLLLGLAVALSRIASTTSRDGQFESHSTPLAAEPQP
jgi:O-antigen ligase